jgi:hypothetical protein
VFACIGFIHVFGYRMLQAWRALADRWRGSVYMVPGQAWLVLAAAGLVPYVTRCVRGVSRPDAMPHARQLICQKRPLPPTLSSQLTVAAHCFRCRKHLPTYMLCCCLTCPSSHTGCLTAQRGAAVRQHFRVGTVLCKPPACGQTRML